MRNVLGSRASIIGLALLTAAMTLVGSDTAVGQEKKKISWTTKPENLTVTFLHRLEIPNMPGHRISMDIVQFNVIIPDLPDGDHEVIAEIAGTETPAGMKIRVQR